MDDLPLNLTFLFLSALLLGALLVLVVMGQGFFALLLSVGLLLLVGAACFRYLKARPADS